MQLPAHHRLPTMRFPLLHIPHLKTNLSTISPSSTSSSFTPPRTLCSLFVSDSDSDPFSQISPFTRVDISVPSLETLPLQYIIREAHIGDFWQVADTHCGAFHPDSVFPMDAILRLDRFLAMCGGLLLLPVNCQRKFLIAVRSLPPDVLKQSSFSIDGCNDTLHLEGIVMGALTVDTIAEFLPRRKSTRRRRTGIAYVSNMAVREKARRKGIAKRLMQEAEQVATQWGCHSIALHCDKHNQGALGLYVGAGYKIIKTPSGAVWPQPNGYLMMKFLGFTK